MGTDFTLLLPFAFLYKYARSLSCIIVDCLNSVCLCVQQRKRERERMLVCMYVYEASGNTRTDMLTLQHFGPM